MSNLDEDSKPSFYLLISSILGKNNSGTLIRSACAFNCKKVFIIGSNKSILKKFFGSQGTLKKIQFEFFKDADTLKTHCIKNNIHICIVGKDYKTSTSTSNPIQSTSFKGDTLFILSNSSNKTSNEFEDACDQYTYVNQYNDIFGDLNLSIIGSIVFHHFALWAKYIEAGLNAQYNKEKYIVNKIQTKNKKLKFI